MAEQFLRIGGTDGRRARAFKVDEKGNSGVSGYYKHNYDELRGHVIESGEELRIDHICYGNDIGLSIRFSEPSMFIVDAQSQLNGASVESPVRIVDRRTAPYISRRWSVKSRENRITIKNESDKDITIGYIEIIDFSFPSNYVDKSEDMANQNIRQTLKTSVSAPVGERIRLFSNVKINSLYYFIAFRSSKSGLKEFSAQKIISDLVDDPLGQTVTSSTDFVLFESRLNSDQSEYLETGVPLSNIFVRNKGDEDFEIDVYIFEVGR